MRFIRWADAQRINLTFVAYSLLHILQVSKWDSIFFQCNNEAIETSRFRQLLWLQYELLLPTLASYYLYDRSLLMSRRNIIFYLFSLTYLVRWALNVRAPEISLACAALHGSRRRFHVNMGFSDDDCNKTICNKCEIYSLSVATSSFKMRFNFLPIQ